MDQGSAQNPNLLPIPILDPNGYNPQSEIQTSLFQSIPLLQNSMFSIQSDFNSTARQIASPALGNGDLTTPNARSETLVETNLVMTKALSYSDDSEVKLPPPINKQKHLPDGYQKVSIDKRQIEMSGLLRRDTCSTNFSDFAEKRKLTTSSKESLLSCLRGVTQLKKREKKAVKKQASCSQLLKVHKNEPISKELAAIKHSIKLDYNRYLIPHKQTVIGCCSLSENVYDTRLTSNLDGPHPSGSISKTQQQKGLLGKRQGPPVVNPSLSLAKSKHLIT